MPVHCRALISNLKKPKPRALVEMSSGEVMAVDAVDMADAWFERRQVWLSFYMDDTLLRGGIWSLI